jgi:two-component system KDP operon response regulator KdpE
MQRTERRRILIVDDEPRIGRMLSYKLRQAGYETVTSISGEEALDLVYGDRQPDFVLLDIFMPGMDGFEVLKNLRSFSDLPVIVFSSSPENGPKALQLGATDFVSKPFNPDDLVDKISKTLNSR